jgi:protein-S-isoprenylcysteine O-methyltransferase Ste14
MESRIEATTTPAVSFNSIRSWDFICRIIGASFFVYLVMANAQGLGYFLRWHPEVGKFHFSASVCAKLLIIAFIALHCLLFVIRWRPIKKSRGSLPRLMAIAGSFFFYLLALPQGEASLVRIIIGSLLLCSGTSLAILALSRLGRSYSMMPEARRLVTTGFYSIVRHPMYLSEEIAIAGIVIQSRFPYALALFTIHLWIQIQRMKNEETVLQKTFPEYVGYKLRTARLIPHVY